MTIDDDRWVEVSPSQFTHEKEGLDLVRAVMPDETPFRAWSNFEFRDSYGRWHEVDLLLLGRGRLHLVELKYYSGRLRGNDHTWLRDGKRPEDSPLKLARRKAQYFASKLTEELRDWAREKDVDIPDTRLVVPFVQESVFLHHPDMRCELSESAAINLFGLDGVQGSSNLPPISTRVLEPAKGTGITHNQELILVDLMQRIGLVPRREREAGSWVITGQSIDSGEGWQDWVASHRVVPTDRARVRFRLTVPSAPKSERAKARSLAEHEYTVMSRLHHDGLLSPKDLVDSELGVGLVYPYDPEWQRLDLWLAGQENGVPLALQLAILRQVAEAVQYAHGNGIVHRAINPRAVWVRSVPDRAGEIKVRVGEWEASGALAATSTTPSPTNAPVGVTRLLGADRASVDAASPDPTAWLTEAFAAPEGSFNPDADRVRLDVFGLGALAFYLLTGGPPARSQSTLKNRLREQGGLDVSVDLPQVGTALRDLVLEATRPAPTERTSTVTRFLANLSAAESADPVTERDVDPLDATPGAVLDGRFRLERRLGKGSTAVGLLVTDLQSPDAGQRRVLKVALDASAGARLADEAEVLRSLSTPRVVALVEGPLVVGGRPALLLEQAGEETLTEVLRTRTRLSIDLLERFGTDLLDILVILDRAGIDHRDIKPSNLGVRESRGDRTKHLVLFDFSLTRAAAAATSAGTPPYLDPFLGTDRDRFDSAAERYSAAVVLYEMAVGRTPVYGDGQADPAAITDDVSIDREAFDPAIADDLATFFRTALARRAQDRHHTAEAMRMAWASVFTTTATTEPDESDEALARAATTTTPLRESGLTARALSALEPSGVSTVGELLAMDLVQVARMPGVAHATRQQIRDRIKQWRSRLGEPDLPGPARSAESLQQAAELLLEAVTSARAPGRGALVRLVLGVGTDLDAFATHAQLAAHLEGGATPSRAGDLLATVQEVWAGDERSRALLDRLEREVSQRLVDLGTVATPAELADAVAASLGSSAGADERVARGLLRLALDRRRALSRAGRELEPAWVRRRAGRVVLVADTQDLFDVVEPLGTMADELVDTAGEPARALVPAARAVERLRTRMPHDAPTELLDGPRLVRLAAALSQHAVASGAGELHHRDLTQATALELSFTGFGGTQVVGPEEVRRRVEARFPGVGPLPQRPALDALVREAHLELTYDDARRVYRPTHASSLTTGLEPRQSTSLGAVTSPVSVTDVIGTRLHDSARSRSFLALGVGADRTDRFVRAARERYGAVVVDVTAVLVDRLRAESQRLGVSWDLLLAGDAAVEGSRARAGLEELVRRSWDAFDEAMSTAAASAAPDSPLLLVEAAPLARYDAMPVLARWSDLGTARERAVWLLVPQLGANRGPVVDGRPVPLGAPSQFVEVNHEWIDGVALAAAARVEG